MPKKEILHLGKPFHDTWGESSDEQFLCGVAFLIVLDLPTANNFRFICLSDDHWNNVNLLELLF